MNNPIRNGLGKSLFSVLGKEKALEVLEAQIKLGSLLRAGIGAQEAIEIVRKDFDIQPKHASPIEIHETSDLL